MDRSELEVSWEVTRGHLRRALRAFEATGGDSSVQGAAEYELEYNELGLCAEVLADGAGDRADDVFWLALTAAAVEMDLPGLANRCMQHVARFPCVCCGRLTLAEPPGSYEICPVCFWEDDLVQLRWPDWPGGANRPTLIEAQQNYAVSGASEERIAAHVREPTSDEVIEPGWRPAEPGRDNFEHRDDDRHPWPDDYTELYWWRTTYWRRVPG